MQAAPCMPRDWGSGDTCGILSWQSRVDSWCARQKGRLPTQSYSLCKTTEGFQESIQICHALIILLGSHAWVNLLHNTASNLWCFPASEKLCSLLSDIFRWIQDKTGIRCSSCFYLLSPPDAPGFPEHPKAGHLGFSSGVLLVSSRLSVHQMASKHRLNKLGPCILTGSSSGLFTSMPVLHQGPLMCLQRTS